MRSISASEERSTSVDRADGIVLSTLSLAASYLKRQVLFDVSLEVRPGEIVAVLGHNGAGKTTLLRTIFGLLPLQRGEVEFDGASVGRSSYLARVTSGMTFTPAEAPVFRELTVRDNLDLGAFTVPDTAVKAERMERVLALFPILRERQTQAAGTLSGGEQRMLSLGMALMAGPKLMLLDEPSLGIGPALVQQIFGQVRELATEGGLAVLMVEQNVRAALRIADRAYFMRSGHVILEEPGEQALARGNWWDLF